ncbi:MAG: 2-amino-4-hydroxy-6-hydroxymethyldihydropteridine diphosphokinase [Caldilineaceae bacterium]
MNDERNAGAVGVVLVLLGSNIDRQRNLPAAIARLRRHPGWQVTAVSSIYESAAVGGSGEQPIFWNAAVCMKTGMTPSVLRNELRLIEAEMGRRRSADKFGAPSTWTSRCSTIWKSKSKAAISPIPTLCATPSGDAVGRDRPKSYSPQQWANAERHCRNAGSCSANRD